VLGSRKLVREFQWGGRLVAVLRVFVGILRIVVEQGSPLVAELGLERAELERVKAVVVDILRIVVVVGRVRHVVAELGLVLEEGLGLVLVVDILRIVVVVERVRHVVVELELVLEEGVVLGLEGVGSAVVDILRIVVVVGQVRHVVVELELVLEEGLVPLEVVGSVVVGIRTVVEGHHVEAGWGLVLVELALALG